MKKQKWLIQALLLGTIFFLAIWIVKPVGVSTQFSVLSGIVHSTINPDIITPDDSRESGYRSTNAYYDKSDGKLAKAIKNPINYDFVFVLSIPFGAYIGYLLNKKRNKSEMAEVGEVPRLSEGQQGAWRLYLPSFISGFLLLYGARMADGCTSGHMMSGMMQGSVSGYIFAASVFAIAIPVAILVGKGTTKGGF